jgi:mannose-6-phosphate isomerase-like protein (cupin superfamily)
MKSTTIEVIHPSREDQLALSTVAPHLPPAASECVAYSGVVVLKPWGYEYQLLANESVAVWVLSIRCGCETSMHCHRKKKTSLVVLHGRVRCSTLLVSREKRVGEGLVLHKGVFHQTRGLSEGGAFVMEVESPPDKHDLVRLSDKYGRVGSGYETSDMHTMNLQDYCYLSFANGTAEHHVGKRLGDCTLSVLHLKTQQEFSQLSSLADSDILCVLRGQLLDARGRSIVKHGDTLPAGIGREGLYNRSQRSVEILVVSSATGDLACSPL